MKTLFFSPLQQKNVGCGRGGEAGIPTAFHGGQPSQPTPTPSPGSPQEVFSKIPSMLLRTHPKPGPKTPRLSMVISFLRRLILT